MSQNKISCWDWIASPMKMRVAKSIGVVVLAVVLLTSAWILGYLRGMIDGKTSVYNGRFIEQKAIIATLIENDPDLSALEITRYGDGNVVLKGELSIEQVRALRKKLAGEIGASRADLTVSKIITSKSR